jgi:hypothetical protein
MSKSTKACFEAELIEGHKGVTVVLVPFDPEEIWRKKPVRLDAKRHGWLVDGTANGKRFQGYVGERWGKFFIQIDADLRERADVGVGDTLKIAVAPTASPKALKIARELAQETTAPKKPRADAVDP